MHKVFRPTLLADGVKDLGVLAGLIMVLHGPSLVPPEILLGDQSDQPWMSWSVNQVFCQFFRLSEFEIAVILQVFAYELGMTLAFLEEGMLFPGNLRCSRVMSIADNIDDSGRRGLCQTLHQSRPGADTSSLLAGRHY